MIIVKIKDGNIVCKVQNRISVKIYGAFIATFNFKKYLNDLPEYDSDESAISGGLSVGDVYKTSFNHVSSPGGLAKEIL